ncbi:NADH-quinone oxidoreductase subunit I [Balneolaceae bacterium ANBcel3]|nr:NADH-quinone oxidoreductase subunit I [Balneolaceae bacterium ANBcel3]
MVKLLNNTYTTFKTIFNGMGITFRHLFKRSVTVQYPEVRDVLPERVRLKLHVNIDDCIGCRLCERACPVECITIGTIKSTDDDDLGETSTGHKKRLWVNQFDIDMAKCCYCELCVHPCPTDCITMVEDYEYSVYDRQDLLFGFSDMTPEQVNEAEEKLAKEALEKKKKKEAAKLAKKKKAESSENQPAADEDAEKAAKKAEREAKRAARRAEKEAEKARKEAEGGASDSGSTGASDESQPENRQDPNE